MANARTIGTIYNFDQWLYLKEENDRFWWTICSNDFPGTEGWEEIPEYLFAALNRFEDESVLTYHLVDAGVQ
jgi:hypothetical protein